MSNAVIVAGILSTIVTVIKEVEARAQEANATGEKIFTGEFKRELAIAMIREVYNKTNPVVPFEQIVEIVKATINTVVSVMNAFKLLKK